VRQVRRRAAGGGKAAKGWRELNGYWWKADETFDIERLLDKNVERVAVGKVRRWRILFPFPAVPCVPSLPP